jgi:queuosine biosynthesis protein QueC
MESSDYTYIFSNLSDTPNAVSRLGGNTAANRVSPCKVIIEDSQLLSLRRVPAEVADLIDLAVSVYVADRLSIRNTQRPCRIQIVIPIRHPEILGNPQVQNQLSETLYWFTGDRWSFDFVRRTRRGRAAESQMTMPLADARSELSAVTLWSGGLDSLAGLCNRLSVEPSARYILLGTGSNTIPHSTQQQVAVRLRSQFPGRIRLVQIPIRLDESTALRKASSQRSRGFVFMLLGAACAYLAGKMTLHIYENGIGAINLPFRASEVGLDHTRSAHPLSLLYMSNLVTELVGARFSVENPFLFSTKAMMCQALIEAGCVDLAFETISCDRLHREKPLQCGYCSSCLLRRQALAVQGVKDQTCYIATARPAVSQAPLQLPLPLKRLKNIATARLDESQTLLWSRPAHLLAMLHQVKELHAILSTRSPWASFVHKYPRLADVVDRIAPYAGIAPEIMRERLICLYQTYVSEWDNDSVRESLGEGLLDSARMQGVA